MSYTSFRDQYLTEAEARLSAVNVGTATTNELLAAGALYKMAAAVADADLIGPSALRLLAGMSGAQLESWLADINNRDAFERIVSSPEAMRAVAASSTAMTAVLASSSAWAAVVASSTAMTAVAASSTAMTAVAASSTAMTAVANSKTALTAIWGSETALAAIRASTSAVDALQASPYTVYISNNPSNLQSTLVSTRCILLRSRNTSGNDTNYLRVRYSNGTWQGDWTYNTSTSWSTQVQAFQDILHYNWSSNYTWQAYIIDCD